MSGATPAESAAAAAERDSGLVSARARVLVLEPGGGGRSVALELDRGRTYSVIAGDKAKSRFIEQLAGTGYAALVPFEGGLIGNLKVWENLVLPLAWQGERNYAWFETRSRSILSALGFDEKHFSLLCRALPERISRFEYRAVTFTRAMLVEPEVMAYDRLFEGLAQSQIEQARAFDAVFHACFPFRTSIYLESDPVPKALVPVSAEYDLR